MGLKYATGILMASGKVGLDNTGASKALVVKADEKQTVLNTKYEANDLIKFTDIKTDYSDLLGMAVKVMYKDKDKVYGRLRNRMTTMLTSLLWLPIWTPFPARLSSRLTTPSTPCNKNGMTIYTIGVDTKGNVRDRFNTAVKNNASDISTAIKAIKDSDMEITVISNDNDEKVDAIFR